MKNLDRRYKRHLSTLSSARSVSGVFILAGVLGIITAIVLGSLLLQSPATGQDAAKESVTTLNENSDTNDQVSGTPDDIVTTIRAYINQLLLKLDWSHIFGTLVGALGILWFGYVLRVLTIVGETQLIEFPHE